MTDAEKILAARERYAAALHAMQSGVALMMNADAHEVSPKHLRVGVNSAMVDSGSICKLLLDKGVITELELYEALAKGAEEEKERYVKKLETMYPGRKIVLV